MTKEIQVNKVNEDQPQILTVDQEFVKKDKLAKLTREKISQVKKVKKRVKLIQKKNKLYFRGKNGELRRLDKCSQDLFDLVMVKFLNGDGENLYAALNKDVKHWMSLKPIDQVISLQYEAGFKRVLAASGAKDSIVVYYNGSWKPLVKLSLEEIVKEPEVVTEK